MIQAYKHNENHVLSAVPLEQLEKGSWINAAAPTLEELVRINELTGIPVDSLQTALDREERSHVELEDDYIFVVVNTPVVLETDAYDALPLGIFITRQYFITVCLEPNTVIQKFLNNSRRRASFSRSFRKPPLPSCISCSRSTSRPMSSRRRSESPCRTRSSSVCSSCRNL